MIKFLKWILPPWMPRKKVYDPKNVVITIGGVRVDPKGYSVEHSNE